ncbi:hypothetical protein L6V77_10780 [Myxococcota bacterium]|nr:hypothetical protein [Myxococcota bacterium]
MSHRRRSLLTPLALAAALPTGLAASTAAAQIILPPDLIERPSNLIVQDLFGWLPADYDQLLPGQNRTGWLAYSVAKQCGFNVWGPHEPVPYRIELVQPGYWQNLGWGWFFDPGQRVSVGSGTIPLEEIVCTTDGWTYGFAPYEFNSDAVRQWAVDTLGAPTTWEIEFVVDPVSAENPAGDVWEDSNAAAPDYETSDNVGVFTPPAPYDRIVPYSGVVKFGGVTTPATTLLADHVTGPCPAGAAPVEITGSTVRLTPAADGSFDPLDMTMVAPTCASLSLAASGLAYDLAVQSGGSARQEVDGTLGGVPVTVGFHLDAVGIVPGDARVPLPAGHSLHYIDERVLPFERPEPYGYPYVYFPRADQAVLTDLGLVSFGIDERRYLHIRGIPFSIRAGHWTLDSGGLLADAAGTHYNHNQPFGELDLRASKPPRSNDNRFWAAPAFIAQVLSITPSGASLSAPLPFGGATATTHFPVVSTRFSGFEASVTNGRISSTRSGFAPGSLRPVAFTLNAACPECGSTGGLSRGYNLMPESDWGVSSTGDAAIKVSDLSNAMWGPAVSDGGATKAVFERIGENEPGQTGVVIVPGHYLVGTEAAGRTAADYLLGAFNVEHEAGAYYVSNVHLNGSYQAKRGNGFFAGLTVGPQTLRSVLGQPMIGFGSSLEGTRTRIAFGGPAGAGGTPPTFGEIEANVGTKLVVRPGGVTGVFNTTTTGASLPQPQVYGYDMSFDRFAFRMVANAMDTVSWVDGRVSLPGRAGFSTGFESLQILCSGDLGGGLLDADESRRKRLVAWKAPYDLRSIGFVPPAGAGLCDDGDRVLETGGEATVAALREALELKTQWYNNGEPAGVSITGKTQNELDRVSSDKRGFLADFKPSGVTLGGVPFNTSVGWFGLEGKVLVPFWKAPAAYVRVENVAGAGDAVTPAPTLVFRQGSAAGFPAGWSGMTNAAVAADAAYKAMDTQTPSRGARLLDAAYQWGGTGFGFDLPIVWNEARKADEQAGFTGRDIKKNLMILDAKAGVQYVTPEKTRINFGASADFEKLKGAQISLNIDLSDPKSVADVESFLKIPNHELSNWIKTIREPATSLLKAVGIGTDGFVKAQLRKFLESETIAGLNVKALFDDLAAKLSAAQALPAKVVKGVFGQIRGAVDQALGALTAPLDQAARDAYRALPGLAGDALVAFRAGDSTVDAGTREALTAVQGALKKVQAGVNGVAGTAGKGLDAVQGVLVTAKSTLATIKTEANNALTAVLAVIDQVLGIIDPARPGSIANNPIFDCREQADAALSKAANPLLAALKTIQDFASTIATALTNNTIGKIAIGVASFIGIDTKPIEQAQQTIGAAAKKVADIVTKARTDVRGLLCGAGGGLTGVVGKAVTFIKQIETPLFDLKAKLNTVFDTLEAKLNDAVAALKAVGTTVQTLATQLNAVVAVADAALVEEADGIADAEQHLLTALGLPEDATRADAENKVREMMNDAAALLGPGGWCQTVAGDPTRCQDGGRTIVTELSDAVREPAHLLITYAETTISAELDSIVKKVPFPTGDEMRTYVINLIMNSPVVEEMEKIFHENYVLVTSKLNELAGQAFDHINNFIKTAVQKLVAQLNEALKAATSAITNNIPVKAAKIDGYATIAGNELERMHVQADFTMNEKKKDSESKFGAALDIVSWSQNGKASCLPPGATASSVVDATISAYGIPLAVGPGDLSARKIYLGFTLYGASPVGFAGGLITDGALKFKAFTLRDIQFHCGAGYFEPSPPPAPGVGWGYLGAKANAQFEGTDVVAAFLVGKVCNDEILRDLDPEVANFVPLPDGKFEGAYVRGSASIPIWNVGCFLTVGAGADVGVWVLGGSEGAAVGGLVGGSVYGKAICLVSLRGGVRLLGNYYAGNFKFQGTGYGVGGFGFDCNPETWTTVARSRDDDWCATGDAQFTATYDNGFNLGSPEVSGIH